jgi:hypothetical protein
MPDFYFCFAGRVMRGMGMESKCGELQNFIFCKTVHKRYFMPATCAVLILTTFKVRHLFPVLFTFFKYILTLQIIFNC